MNITLLKLGGSLITDKSKPYTANPDSIHQILVEVKDIIQKKPDLRMIIGHGAGSFAHQSAKKYNTMHGFSNDKGKIGACIVHSDAMKLHQIVLDECTKLELSVFSIQPAAFIMAQNKEFYRADFSILKELLRKGLTPLMFGDVIVDSQIGSTIFSTDKLFTILVNQFADDEFDIKQIIHVGNFDGVMDENGSVISEITKKNYSQISQLLGESGNTDVTGGMKNKVEEAITLTRKGIQTKILNGMIKGNLTNLILHNKKIGTTIL